MSNCCSNPISKSCVYLSNNFVTSFPAIYPINSYYIEEILDKGFEEYGINIHDKIYNILKKNNVILPCYYYYSTFLLAELKGKINNEDLDNTIIYENFIGGIMYLLYYNFSEPSDNSNVLNILAQENRKILDKKNKKYHKSLDFINKNATITEIKQEIMARRYQDKFKKALLEKNSKCKICGLGIIGLLIGSHIKPWSNSNNKERLDIDNGLLLCRQHDGLFDKGYISFNNNGNIIISKTVNINEYPLLNINENIKISLSEENKKYLNWHRENRFIDNKK